MPCSVDGSNTLFLNGFHLGCLQIPSNSLKRTEVWHAEWKAKTIVRNWAFENLSTPGSATISRHPYHTGEDRLQAFWRTLVGDCKGYPQTRLTSEDIEHDQNLVEKAMGADANDADKTLDLRLHLRSYNILSKLVFKDGWRFHISDNDLFVLAQSTAQAGDVIAVLDGAKTPMVLRPTGKCEDGNETYRPICGAYVHGFMDGEAMNPENGLEEKTFRIV